MIQSVRLLANVCGIPTIVMKFVKKLFDCSTVNRDAWKKESFGYPILHR